MALALKMEMEMERIREDEKEEISGIGKLGEMGWYGMVWDLKRDGCIGGVWDMGYGIGT